MRETRISRPGLSSDVASFLACLATILEVAEDEVPEPSLNGDISEDWNILSWLGSLGIGLVSVVDPKRFAWTGPWIARVQYDDHRRSVVMYGRSPSGVVWDPNGNGLVDSQHIEDGFVIAAEDIALGRPRQAAATATRGAVEQIWLAEEINQSGRMLDAARVIPGLGLDGDRYTDGRGTFPSPRHGAALTLIEAEVCEGFDPPLSPDEHRRNVVTRGVKLNGLVGVDFSIGAIRCRGIRLCEPCATMQRYTERAILRPLVHRGGLRADILDEGEIRVGDEVVVVAGPPEK